MTGVTWLHISDWHQQEKTFDRKIVCDALIDSIRHRDDISPDLKTVDFIVFSGDLAFSGSEEEYQTAEEKLFKPLLDACELKPEKLFIVPGNHDLQLDKIPATLSEPIASTYEVNNWLFNPEKLEEVLKPFGCFEKFVCQYTEQVNSNYANTKCLEIDGRKISLFGMNSAWMCGRKKKADGRIDEKGLVIIGEPQVCDTLKEISESDIKISVLHHPLEWLASHESKTIDHLIAGSDFILHGHQHKQMVVEIKSTSGNCIIIPAGACYARRDYPNAYNFVHLNFKNATGTVFLRSWNDEKNKWQATDSYPNGKFEFQFSHKTEKDILNKYCASIVKDLSLWRGLGSFRNNEIKQIYVHQRLLDRSRNREEVSDSFVLKDLLERSTDGSTVLVEGTAGCGKTMLLQNWAVTMAQTFIEEPGKDYVPIYLPLGWIERMHGTGPWTKLPIELAAERYPDIGGQASQPLIEALTNAMKNNRIVILLDAVDEISEQAANHFRDWWDKTRESRASCPIVLTSRPVIHINGVRVENKLFILKFNTEQREQFIKNWFGKEVNKVSALQAHLQQSVQLQDPIIAGNPLFLTMMCIEFEERGKLSATPAQLLDMFVRLLLEFWDKERGVDRTLSLVPLDLKLRVMESVATKLFDMNRIVFTEREFIDHTIILLNQLSSSIQVNVIIDEIVNRSGLLIKDRRRGDYQFCHNLFLEYFVARDKAFGLEELDQESWLQKAILERNHKYDTVIQFYNELRLGA